MICALIAVWGVAVPLVLVSPWIVRVLRRRLRQAALCRHHGEITRTLAQSVGADQTTTERAVQITKTRYAKRPE